MENVFDKLAVYGATNITYCDADKRNKYKKKKRKPLGKINPYTCSPLEYQKIKKDKNLVKLIKK